MDAYQGSASGDIGTLLRLIQEDKSSNPLNQAPGSQPGSAIRGLTTGPVLTPEAPGTSRMVSIQPEGIAPATPQAPSVVPAGGVTAPTANVVGPVAPKPPAPVAQVQAPSTPQAPISTQSRPASPSISAPAIGTKLSPTKGVLGASTSPGQELLSKILPILQFFNTPLRSTFGQPTANVNPKKVPIPTPTPAKSNKAPSKYVGYTA